MCGLRFKVTLTSTHRAILPPVPGLNHRGGKCSQRAATAPRGGLLMAHSYPARGIITLLKTMTKRLP